MNTGKISNPQSILQMTILMILSFFIPSFSGHEFIRKSNVGMRRLTSHQPNVPQISNHILHGIRNEIKYSMQINTRFNATVFDTSRGISITIIDYINR